MEDTAIEVKDMSKAFKLPHEKQNSLKSAIINFRHRGYERQEVLNNINFQVKKGDFFGIVGRNGSGKSTLLKLLAGIYSPDQGEINVNGRLTPFIELGVGFNPELTGRENVYLNGALLGFNRKEMNAMYDEIVAFAELERFMDQKLKNYSSGMQVRLAFSIAIRAEGDVLLLDEVLAVGDEAFQRKCYSYFENLKRERKTVVLVTHDMAAVEKYCSRAMLIQEGKITVIGNPHDVASAYSTLNDMAYESSPSNDVVKESKGDLKVKLMNLDKKETVAFTSGDELSVSVRWNNSNVKNVGVAIYTQAGEYIYGTNTYVDNKNVDDNKIIYHVQLDLAEGDYYLQIGLFGDTDEDHIEIENHGPSFIVNRNKQAPRWEGKVKLKSKWL